MHESDAGPAGSAIRATDDEGDRATLPVNRRVVTSGLRIRDLDAAPDTLDAYGRSAHILTPELLRRLAVDEGRSARDIASRTGFSPRTVLTHLHAAGIPARPAGRNLTRRPLGA